MKYGPVSAPQELSPTTDFVHLKVADHFGETSDLLRLIYSHYCSHGICLLVLSDVGIEAEYLHSARVQLNWKKTSKRQLSTQTNCASRQRKVAGVTQHILPHTQTHTLLLTLWIKVRWEPWGVLWSQRLCHLAELWRLFVGTSQKVLRFISIHPYLYPSSFTTAVARSVVWAKAGHVLDKSPVYQSTQQQASG